MPYRVLVADDSPMTARAAQAALPEPAFEVQVAADGAKAERALLEGPPDAVLAALALPLKDGYELGATLRARAECKTTALLFLRGVVEPLDVGRLAAIDHDGVIRKPFDGTALARLVRQAVEHRRVLPTIPEESAVQVPVAEPAAPPERITVSLGLDETPLERTLRNLVREEFGRADWDERMRGIAAAEFRKLLVAELNGVTPRSK